MASPEQIADLRDLINEPDDTNGWTDERLSALIDGTTTLNLAAGKVWVLKAGQYSSLVDVAESGSSRKLGDMYKNAMAMAKYFDDLDGTDPVVAGDRPVIGRIRRGFA